MPAHRGARRRAAPTPDPAQAADQEEEGCWGRTDAAGATHEHLDYLTRCRLAYSIGFALTEAMATQIYAIPAEAWTPAYDSDGGVRGERGWLSCLIDLSSWPDGMRLLERPVQPGAQLRFTDHDGLRSTAFVTNATRGQLAELESSIRTGSGARWLQLAR